MPASMGAGMSRRGGAHEWALADPSLALSGDQQLGLLVVTMERVTRRDWLASPTAAPERHDR